MNPNYKMAAITVSQSHAFQPNHRRARLHPSSPPPSFTLSADVVAAVLVNLLGWSVFGSNCRLDKLFGDFWSEFPIGIRCREKQRKEASRLQTVNIKLNVMNKLLMEEKDQLQKQVSQLVCENGFMRQQLHTVPAAATAHACRFF
ncbi:homeobox-leucine zipper protein REVOLUTA isoform X2 [Cucumis melo var. makuwa]|uniref:Homeobox-leucine zipper protein REVOLUTA isoform X2 n=1 Tax=Cucumis melo var. makuwa TaxID=1194695 RepID=A0A5A7VFB3_CUCMM|nr:homeobox-leucine zipper protein REVOLUTA isoform X2 [Cucumis melo var. makuwa]TYK18589.1 homeobox-leucine zipper protein REVOLUTA isoform X2 [Cucumis melo var. makuwa]